MDFFIKCALGTMGLFIFSSPICAQVEIRTNIMDIYYQGTYEETGAIAFQISSNEFPLVHPEDCVYIRVELQSGAVLTETRVAPGALRSGRGLESPIYLAAALRDLPSDYSIFMGRDAIAVVRWVAGETAFWLRITESTSSWLISHTGNVASPALGREVSFYVGLSDSASWNNSAPYFVNGYANLPCNTRDIASASPEDTRIHVDVSHATLTVWPDPDGVLEVGFTGFDDTTLGVTTAVHEDDIVLGVPTFAVFLGDTVIARGLDFLDLHLGYFVFHWFAFYQIDILDLVLRVNNP